MFAPAAERGVYAMKIAVALVTWLWWLSVASVPVCIWLVERSYMNSIGCPPNGDCYVPGSEILLAWDTLILGTVLLLWPVCIWQLGVKQVARWLNKSTHGV